MVKMTLDINWWKDRIYEHLGSFAKYYTGIQVYDLAKIIVSYIKDYGVDQELIDLAEVGFTKDYHESKKLLRDYLDKLVFTQKKYRYQKEYECSELKSQYNELLTAFRGLDSLEELGLEREEAREVLEDIRREYTKLTCPTVTGRLEPIEIMPPKPPVVPPRRPRVERSYTTFEKGVWYKVVVIDGATIKVPLSMLITKFLK